MRIGILADSFLAAWTIRRGLEDLKELEVFIILNEPMERSWWHRKLRNAGHIVVASVKGGVGPIMARLAEHVISLSKPLDHEDSIARLRELRFDVGLHKSGTIYRESTINAFRLGILNPHIGMLPAYRGRNVMEWSILQGDPVGITVFFIDSGIDTGARIVVSERVDISHCRSIDEAKRFLFDLDVVFFRKALAILMNENPPLQVNDGSGHRYYVMSKLFKGVVEQLMREPN